MSELREIPVADIAPHPQNPRRAPAKAKIAELADDIKAVGLVQPIVVRDAKQLRGPRYQLIAGERRWRAHQHAKLDTIRAIVVDVDDRQAHRMMVAENAGREDLTPLEEANGVALLLADGLSIQEVATEMGKSVSWVAGRNALANLTEGWKEVLMGNATKGPRMDDEAIEDLQSMPVAGLELIARLAPAAQDEVLSAIWEGHFWNGITVDAIRHLADQCMRVLSAASWKLDDAQLLPAAGACNVCPKRSSCQPELFEDLKPGKRGELPDHCLDPVCWKSKARAMAELQIQRVTEKTGKPPLLLNAGCYRGNDANEDPLLAKSQSRYHFTNVKKSDPKAQVAVMVSGPDAGKVQYVRPDSGYASSGSSAGGGKTGGKKSLKEREAQLGKKRARHIAEAMKARIDQFLTTDDGDLAISPEPEARWVAIVCLYGCWRDDAIELARERDPSHEDATVVLSNLEDDNGHRLIIIRRLAIRTLGREIIKAVNATTYNNTTAVAKLLRCCATVCDWLGWNYSDFEHAAHVDNPEPKSWAQERAQAALDAKKAKAKKPAKKAAGKKAAAKKSPARKARKAAA